MTTTEQPATPTARDTPRSIAVLLVAQGVSLGFTLANLIIPGSAVFLSAFGSARLPYVYLIVAVAGSGVSMVVNRLQARFGLQHLAVGATLIVAVTIAFAWWLVSGLEAASAGYLVLTLFAVHLQMGFVFIGAQAGRALDVQRIKSVFPRIVSGFVFGFMVGGFLADPLQTLLGRSEHLLLVGAAAAFVMAWLMAMVGRVMPSEETDVGEPDVSDEVLGAERPPPLRALLAVPLVSAVFVYQVLSAMGTQLVDYLVFDRAVARYSGAEELTSFMGGFTAILNLTDLVVLALVGSLIMARYGLRFGVAANPVVVTALLAIGLGVSAFFGTGSSALFVLIGIARISDITLADLATRTSVNATFQVLPPHQRLAAQVGVEGVGVPLALGLTAVMILIINALFASPTVPVLIATMLVCVAWCWYSFVVFGRYREGTVLAARRRMLDDVQVDLTEPATRAALIDLTKTGGGSDVRAAIDLLATDPAHDLAPVLSGALARGDLEVDYALLGSLLEHDPDRALSVASACVESGDRRFVIDGLRALGQVGGPHAAAMLTAAVDDVDAEGPELKAVALGALVSVAGGEGPNPGRTMLDRLVTAAEGEDRVLAAQAIGELGSIDDVDHLLDLLVDSERTVRVAAAVAVGHLPDGAQATVFQQLVDTGNQPAIDEFLRRLVGQVGPRTCETIADWLSRVDGAAVPRTVRFLVGNGYRADLSDPVVGSLIDASVARAASAAHWIDELAGSDELDGDWFARLVQAVAVEREEAQQHLIETLALVYDRDLLRRVGHLWSDRVEGDHAMAREALDLTLDDRHRAAVLSTLTDGETVDGSRGSRTAVEALARSTEWAAESDWLQASALATLGYDGNNRPDGIEPRGPVTAELLAVTQRQ